MPGSPQRFESYSESDWDWRWNPCRVARRLNIGCVYRRIIGDFLLKIADRDVERGSGDEIGRRVVNSSFGQAAGWW